MNPSFETVLQKQLDESLLFTPCLGINVTIHNEKYGFWTGSSGFLEPKTRTPMPIDGQFYIYSITKTFTAVCLLQMVQKGKLSLDDVIAHWLPNLPFPPSVTIRRLLNHTSGVPNYSSLAAYMPAVEESPSFPWSYNKFLELTCQGKLDFEPGSSWNYSNTGYMLLLKLIETITEDTFFNTLKKQIFQPLELQKTYVAQNIDKETLVPGFCRYLNPTRLLENVILKYHPGWCATGVVVSTTNDIVQFYENIFSGNLLYSEQLKEMRQYVSIGQNTSPFFQKPCYGLGLMIDPESVHGKKFGHGGDGPGYNTWVMHLPNFQGRKLTMAVFCNTSMGSHPFNLINDLLYILSNV
ncbi:serine hydrolase domain-containing protein [Gloeocapsopsis dulcis]|uniref:Serine hydrolase n=1 Tax=Gloeocapsopsis dulcis AAB1 = 1H9 TaxID=1433147 RepID=A0A6N8FVD3_9CHRO|nr:serine hydrolase domain-containing protein [Gloeocapsopsis dulcis]MUL35906.1 serine hydrolase [Gloeocapsopsis dulcis AAB1 = 1H9]WNN87626.1 serine hydrolase [Gloeocapsopsis dulcis]